jgi:hypothetical protein
MGVKFVGGPIRRPPRATVVKLLYSFGFRRIQRPIMMTRALPAVSGLVLLIGLACGTSPPPPASSPAASPPPPSPTPTATVPDGPPTEEQLELAKLREACGKEGIPLPATPSAEERAKAELLLARKLGLDVPPDTDVLIVDHAWVKDAKKKATTAKQRKALEELRAAVVAGKTIPKAFETLPGVDGKVWHIGDHEEYPYTVVPGDAHDLAPGSVSPIIPGDGGLHLFQIYSRKQTPPPADAVHQLVRDKLGETAAN